MSDLTTQPSHRPKQLSDLSNELLDIIAEHIPDDADCDDEDTPTLLFWDPRVRDSLCNLRSTSKRLADSGARVLFRRVHLGSAEIFSRGRRPGWRINRIAQLSLSTHRTLVKEFLITFDAMEGSTYLSDRLRDWLRQLQQPLPQVLARFNTLQFLSIRNYPIDYLSERYYRYWSGADGAETMFVHVITSVLRAVTFPSTLERVQLSLPRTGHFANLVARSAATPAVLPQTRNLLRSLKHLELMVGDDPLAEEYIPQGGWVDNDSRQLFAPLRFTTAKLEFLSLKSGQGLNLDVLAPANLTQLRRLHLTRFQTSAHRFISLLSQNKATLHDIRLDRVDLKTGTWMIIMLELCRLQHLTRFSIDACRYSPYFGASAQWHDAHSGRFVAVTGHAAPMESVHFPDFNALGNVQRHVLDNRIARGLPVVPVDDFQYVGHVPVQAAFPLLFP